MYEIGILWKIISPKIFHNIFGAQNYFQPTEDMESDGGVLRMTHTIDRGADVVARRGQVHVRDGEARASTGHVSTRSCTH